MGWEWFVFLMFLIPSILSGFALIWATTALGRGWGLFWGVFIFIAAFIPSFFVLAPYRFVDNYELGYLYDSYNGQITVLKRTGYFEVNPILQSVHTIDLRPRQVCINVGGGNRDSQSSNTVNQRVLNCKLVSFNPNGIALFLSWHGRGDYYGDLLNDLLKIYAYDRSGRAYPFLNVSDETRPVVGPQDVGQPLNAAGTPVTK